MWTNKKSIKSLQSIWEYGKAFRGLLFRGYIATMGVVLFRLAMPWPLRGFIEIVMPGKNHRGQIVVGLIPSWGDPVIWLALSYVFIALGLGLCEMIQRIAMKKYATYTMHGMRAFGVRGILLGSDQEYEEDSADLITRLVGDTARAKAEMSGILVHASQNGLLFIGICVVFLFLSPILGFFFMIGGLLAVAIGYRTTIPVAASALKHRRKESKYALMIHDMLGHGDIYKESEKWNIQSANIEVRTTRMIAISSLLVHVTLALVTACALWVAVHEVQAGELVAADLFLFIAYVLTAHRRMVQVGRQLARSGKMFANVRRVAKLGSRMRAMPLSYSEKHLTHSMELHNISLDSSQNKELKRLAKINLIIPARTHILILGESGSGKSTLLRVMADRLPPDRGSILWDGEKITDSEDDPMLSVSYLPQNPVFKPERIWKFLGLQNEQAGVECEKMLRHIGAWKVIACLPSGFNNKLSSHMVSVNQARALSLGSILLKDSDVWMLDAPLEGLDKRTANRRLKEILTQASGRTLIISMVRPIKTARFDRIIVIRKGKIRFDGKPNEWKNWEEEQRIKINPNIV